MRISDVFGMLIAVYNDWGGILANPNFIRSNHEITWPNRHRIDVTVPADIVTLAENRQYSFQTSDDGSLIQMYYHFPTNTGDVSAASLAYYGAPFSENQPDPSNLEQENFEEARAVPTGEITNLKWLRIDFDPPAARGILHHECHLHLSNFPMSRLMVRGLPTPRQFVEFVLALCHPTSYENHRLDATGAYRHKPVIDSVNEQVFSCEENELFGQLMHIRTPRT